MRLIYILPLFALLAFANSRKDKVSVFYKQTDVAKAGLKGKVRSLVNYHCSLDSSVKYCSVFRRKYNERGFLTEKTDTSSSEFYSYKYFYNEDGLLIKQVFMSKIFKLDNLETWEETYSYSFSDRRKTKIFRQNDAVDTIVTLYDKNGNEIQYSSKTIKSFSEYDEHGFLVLEKSISPTLFQDTFIIRYINDAMGRPLKVTRSDGTLQTLVYNKDGNQIQVNTRSKSGKVTDWYDGYCELDKNGNWLKKISMCPQMNGMNVDSLVIEYY